jgi:hypothetical protein
MIQYPRRRKNQLLLIEIFRLHTVVSVYIEYNCVPVIIAVKSENDIASNARNIKKIIVAGGDHVAHAN